jgi:hypothetical protein
LIQATAESEQLLQEREKLKQAQLEAKEEITAAEER